MLEGLKINVVSYSEVLKNNDLRIEAEYHTTKGLTLKNYYLGKEILELEQYNSTYGLNDMGNGYPTLRMHEFQNIFTGTATMYFDKLSIEKFEELRLKKKDILICRTNGNPALIGKSALVAKDYPYIYESHLFKVRVKESMIKAAATVIYLNTKFGRDEIDKLSMQGNQANFSLAKFKEIKFPKFSTSFNENIDFLVFDAFKRLEQSQILYTEAENILLKELGLANWHPTIKNNNTKTFKESFLQTGRFDAEYYQPKYDEVIDKVSHLKNDTLGNVVNIQKSIEPGSDAYQTDGIPFIRVADLSKNGITESSVYLSKEVFADFPLMPKENTILLSKDGSVGIAYKVESDVYGITSSAILHLTVKREDVLTDYLCLVINSIIVKLQAERDAGGSIIQHWKPDEIKQVIIPILNETSQIIISNKIQQSFALQKQSKALLEAAKNAVEIAIEKNEKEALRYLENQLNSSNE